MKEKKTQVLRYKPLLSLVLLNYVGLYRFSFELDQVYSQSCSDYQNHNHNVKCKLKEIISF